VKGITAAATHVSTRTNYHETRTACSAGRLQEQLQHGVHCLTWPTPPAEEESLVLLFCDWPPGEGVTQTGWPVDQLVVDFPASHTA
jgi:hypothetical protein